MKKLYRATYHIVICADDLHRANMIADEYSSDGDLFIEPSSLSEIQTLDDVPTSWECDNFPVIDKNGNLDADTIEEILNKRTNSSLQEEIKALKQRVKELEKQINK